MDQTQPLRVWRMIGLVIMATLIFWGCSYYFIKWTANSYEQEAVAATSEATIHASRSDWKYDTGWIRFIRWNC